jgi:hypothetical protein
MADEQTAVQGDTTAAVGSDQATTTPEATATTAVPVAPATPAVVPEGDGLLSGNKEGDVAPESYESFKVDEALGFGDSEQEWFKAAAKDSGLPQEQAQKAVDMFVKGIGEYKTQQEGVQKEAFEKFRDDNKATWEQNPEHATLTLQAQKAVDKLGIGDYLKETGYVHDAKLLGAFAELGRFMGESTAVSGGEVNGSGDKSVAQILFPNL